MHRDSDTPAPLSHGAQDHIWPKCGSGWTCSSNANACSELAHLYSIVSSGSGICSFQGDPHYVSYDGKRFNYMGTCRYLVASPAFPTTTPYFQVFGRNENRYGETAVSYVRYVDIVYGGITVRLSRMNSLAIGTVNVTVSRENYLDIILCCVMLF